MATRNLTYAQPVRSSVDLAGNFPEFPGTPGSTLPTGLNVGELQQKRLLFNRLSLPGQIHVYSGECRAGDRLCAQMLVPVLPLGGSVAPSFAVVAQSLPYSADTQKLPFPLPAGFSAVVAPALSDLVEPTADALTRVRYYPGPTIDTRTLVSGRVYVVVWSPHNHSGKYVLQIGHRWPLRWTYWMKLPYFWWRIRGWFGLSRLAAYLAAGALLVAGAVTWTWLASRQGRRESDK